MKGKNQGMKTKSNKYGKNSPKASKKRFVPEVSNRGEREVQHKYNDVSWYAKNEAMLRDAASFSYNSPLGDILPLSFSTNAANTAFTVNYRAIPGLMGITFVPCPGLSTDSTSPANLAAQNIYSYVRYMNSGAKNYDQADLMLYLLTMDSVYMAWNWAKRIYGYARLYSQKNRYLPTIFAQADNINLNDVVANLADYRLQLNSLAAQISSFCVPAVMPLFIRHSWLVSNIYKDADNDKAQMYMFVPDIYYTYDETGSTYGGQLLRTRLRSGSTPLTASQIIARVKTAIDRVAYSEDIGVMSGDILKAYGQDKLFKISPVDPEYEVLPTYNEEVLNQIHNSTVIEDSSLSNADVTQDPNTGFLIWNPTFNTTQIFPNKALINMPWNEITPANTMVATRLTSMLQYNGPTTAVGMCMGTEYVNHRIMYYYTESSSGGSPIYGNKFLPPAFIFNQTPADEQDTLFRISCASNFDWHPLVPMFVATTQDSKSVNNFCGYLGDMTNYTLIEKWNMEQMHLTAILSEFNVPQLGSF